MLGDWGCQGRLLEGALRIDAPAHEGRTSTKCGTPYLIMGLGSGIAADPAVSGTVSWSWPWSSFDTTGPSSDQRRQIGHAGSESHATDAREASSYRRSGLPSRRCCICKVRYHQDRRRKRQREGEGRRTRHYCSSGRRRQQLRRRRQQPGERRMRYYCSGGTPEAKKWQKAQLRWGRDNGG